METKGIHILLDMFDCRCRISLLDDQPILTTMSLNAIRKSKNKVIKVINHQFEPQGISVIAMLAESHFTIHTYPEEKYASVDIYSCGKYAEPQKAIDDIILRLRPSKYKLTTITRGVDSKSLKYKTIYCAYDSVALGYITIKEKPKSDDPVKTPPPEQELVEEKTEKVEEKPAKKTKKKSKKKTNKKKTTKKK